MLINGEALLSCVSLPVSIRVTETIRNVCTTPIAITASAMRPNTSPEEASSHRRRRISRRRRSVSAML
jgi:hypothetical protein